MAPNFPVNVDKPVGKFYDKFGQHLHSVGYKVDDLVGLGDRPTTGSRSADRSGSARKAGRTAS